MSETPIPDDRTYAQAADGSIVSVQVHERHAFAHDSPPTVTIRDSAGFMFMLPAEQFEALGWAGVEPLFAELRRHELDILHAVALVEDEAR